MLPFHHILFPTDFSERSEYAFRLACLMARDCNARLTIVHVVPPPMAAYVGGVMTPELPRYDDEWAKLHRMRLPDPRVSIEHLLAEGDTAAMILHVARERKCDAIVMGSHGRTGLSRVLLGSVAEEVTRKAPCPVVIVKTPLGEAKPTKAGDRGVSKGEDGLPTHSGHRIGE
jgi:nucleotide-binding universal stress UspA family protein